MFDCDFHAHIQYKCISHYPEVQTGAFCS